MICVAVTGATGYLGQFVCQDLVSRGYQVRALARQQAIPHIAGVEWRMGDLGSPEVAASLLNGTQHLVHCAFQHEAGRYRGGEGSAPEAFWQNNFFTTRQLLEIAATQHLDSVVLISSRAVFDGYPAGYDLNDNVAPKPTTLYGTLKVAEEALAHQYSTTTSLQVRCLRSSGIFGLIQPLEQSKWWDLVQQALKGGSNFGNQGVTETHGADVAAAIHLLLAPMHDQATISYNCSDIVVSPQMLANHTRNPKQSLAQHDKPLPPSGATLNSNRLHSLGWTPSGLSHVQQVLTTMIQAQKLGSNQG